MLYSYLQTLAEFLAADTGGFGTGPPNVNWIVGDWETAMPRDVVPLPIGFIIPNVDQLTAHGGGPGGHDMHAYTVPIWVVDDIARYGPPAQVGAHWESPGWANLQTLTESVVKALRHTILHAPQIARSDLTKFEYGPLKTPDGTVFRAARAQLVSRERINR